LIFLLVPSAHAAVSAGVTIGQQSYASTSDNPRVLTSADILWQRGAAGVHVAGEYADLTEEGALIVTHADLVYRHIGSGYSFLIGAGPTYVNVASNRFTWNAEAELGHSFGRVEVFGRVRQYEYGLFRSHEGDAGPDGPAFYAGVRFALTH
jgi:hypothetical protein